ncbi:H-NS family nucleoid-associated regulatory protein [Achromobacter sp. NFACC18-2]|uniref:H-NS histone family protein n=1 Tax=Achromobacter sp. NFACC18-2 TaxID=1564112 RepID=UPI0008C09768|nr:H-NS histone family protein [Achromobacter sp. NFACC18-2]SEI47429.1 DNA-binding protein H-NS [Achromobacter sp. NFACC18-2]
MKQDQDYWQVKERIRSLEVEAEHLRRQALQLLVADIRQKIREYGITQGQLFGPDLSDLVRYRHPETGQTWNGIGRPPNWIRGQDRKRFLVV